MNTITRQQAQQIIESADAVITALAGTNEDVHPDNSTKMVQLYDDLNDHYAPPEVVRELARIALASLEAEESGRNPVLAYSDSYRDMAKQGVESIPVWSVITDLERNIAPLYTTPPAPVVPDGLRLALSNAGISAPESDEMLAATCEKHIQALVTWVKDRKPFQSAPIAFPGEW